GDEGYHRLLHFGLDVGRGFLFGRATDLSDHDYGMCLGVSIEHRQHLALGGAYDRVTSHAHAGRLPDAAAWELVYGLVYQSAGARDNADMAGLEHAAGHNADAALAGRNHAGAVGANEGEATAAKGALHGHHVDRGNALGDADDHADPRVRRFEDCVG